MICNQLINRDNARSEQALGRDEGTFRSCDPDRLWESPELGDDSLAFSCFIDLVTKAFMPTKMKHDLYAKILAEVLLAIRKLREKVLGAAG